MWVSRVAGVVVAAAVVVMGGASAAPGSQGRQFLSNLGNSLGLGTAANANNNGYNNKQGYATNNIAYISRNGYTHTNNDYGTGNSQQGSSSSQQGSSSSQVSPEYYYAAAAQQYPNTAGYYGFYESSPDYTHGTYAPAAWHGSGTAAAHGTDSSPALSALALLGFLYFLNLIQDVLQNNNGRRRRSFPTTGIEGRRMEEHKVEEEEEGHYITSYLEDEPMKGGNGTDGEEEEEKEEEVTGDSQVEPRAFSFLEDFFIRLPQALGMRKRQMVDRLSRDEMPIGITSFITSRVKMISSIMSFLQDPSPSRIRRALQDTESEEPVEGKAYSEAFSSPSLESFVPLMIEVLREYSPFESWPAGVGRAFSQENTKSPVTVEAEGKGEKKAVRRRRHSPTSMNAWYNELGGRNKEAGAGVGGVAAKVISLLGGSDVAQQVVKQEAVPALKELSRGLAGSSPHCLQRVLCRLTSHASQLSLLPRMAFHMLSSNFVGESEEAVKAGLRGENCSHTFSECDTDSKLGKTWD